MPCLPGATAVLAFSTVTLFMAISEAKLRAAIDGYVDPYLQQTLEQANAVRSVELDADRVVVKIELGFPTVGYTHKLQSALQRHLAAAKGAVARPQRLLLVVGDADRQVAAVALHRRADDQAGGIGLRVAMAGDTALGLKLNPVHMLLERANHLLRAPGDVLRPAQGVVALDDEDRGQHGTGESSQYSHGRPLPTEPISNPAGTGRAGQVMVVELELAGQRLTFMNGGPNFKLDEAFSLSVACEDQAEIDRLWAALGDKPSACGWTRDKFGVVWQINYAGLPELMTSQERTNKVMAAMMTMVKIDIQPLKDAVT